MTSTRSSDQAGSTLLEVIVATGLLAVGLVSLGQLFGISTKNNTDARAGTYATVLAAQKMEQLRALTFGFDVVGLPLTDTSSNTALESPAGGSGLAPSPAGSLDVDTAGYVDYVALDGTVVGNGAAVPAAATFVRRWSIEPLPANPDDVIVLQVRVARVQTLGAHRSARVQQEARIVSVKTRRSQ